MTLEATLTATVLRAVNRLRDTGLAARVLRDEARHEQDAARDYIESGYVFCKCGELIGDRHGLQGHLCSRRWAA